MLGDNDEDELDYDNSAIKHVGIQVDIEKLESLAE